MMFLESTVDRMTWGWSAQVVVGKAASHTYKTGGSKVEPETVHGYKAVKPFLSFLKYFQNNAHYHCFLEGSL